MPNSTVLQVAAQKTLQISSKTGPYSSSESSVVDGGPLIRSNKAPQMKFSIKSLVEGFLEPCCNDPSQEPADFFQFVQKLLTEFNSKMTHSTCQNVHEFMKLSDIMLIRLEEFNAKKKQHDDNGNQNHSTRGLEELTLLPFSNKKERLDRILELANHSTKARQQEPTRSKASLQNDLARTVELSSSTDFVIIDSSTYKCSIKTENPQLEEMTRKYKDYKNLAEYLWVQLEKLN